MTRSVARNQHFRVETLGLAVAGRPTYADWARFGTVILALSSSAMWSIGDWLNYGESTYGEKYSQALDGTRKSYQSLRNTAWVCGRFDLSRRRDNLSFSHHQEVAKLEPAEADALLDMAEREGWTREELRAAVREAAGVATTSKRALAESSCPFGLPVGLTALIEWLEETPEDQREEDVEVLAWLRAHRKAQ